MANYFSKTWHGLKYIYLAIISEIISENEA